MLLEQILKRMVDSANERGLTPVKELHQLPGWNSDAAKYLEDCDIIRCNSNVWNRPVPKNRLERGKEETQGRRGHNR